MPARPPANPPPEPTGSGALAGLLGTAGVLLTGALALLQALPPSARTADRGAGPSRPGLRPAAPTASSGAGSSGPSA